MKRIAIRILLPLLLLGLLSGCKQTATTDGKFTVMTTFYPLYLAAANLTQGTDTETLLLTQPTGGCLHDYQLTPGELKQLQEADLVLAVGGGMENFLSRITQNYPNLPLYECNEGIELLAEEGLEQAEEALNAHYWVAPENYMRMMWNVSCYLRLNDPRNSEKYQENYDIYSEKIAALSLEMADIKNVSNHKIVTFHEAFAYWEELYGLDVVATIEQEPGTDPTPGELAGTIALVKEQGVTALFAEPQYSDNAAQTIARETGAAVYVLDPVAGGPMDDLTFYETAMMQNLQTLKSALG